MAKKATKKKGAAKSTAKPVAAKKAGAPVRARVSAGRSEPAPLDPIAAALQRRRQAMLSH